MNKEERKVERNRRRNDLRKLGKTYRAALKADAATIVPKSRKKKSR